ncbi:L-rhamnose mutarotase [Psychromicrobium xiongbiense]|uniref:L-rhamnose mutarotase n=1 Tax=Psychromicrobium xiongbiense TaxID=3051184 RepID=UPI0025553CF3|nr:L-rhamnose mutarotase [Psychromicrobium sp. YIM S02556]
MQRIALHTRLRPGLEVEYEEAHAVIWPELDVLLRKHGVHAWRIWRSGTELFHEVEVEDWEVFTAGMAKEPLDQAWQVHMNQFLDTSEGQSYQRMLHQVWELPQGD